MKFKVIAPTPSVRPIVPLLVNFVSDGETYFRKWCLVWNGSNDLPDDVIKNTLHKLFSINEQTLLLCKETEIVQILMPCPMNLQTF